MTTEKLWKRRTPYIPRNMFNIDLSKENFDKGYREYMRLYMKREYDVLRKRQKILVDR